jgi:hypothetical protein
VFRKLTGISQREELSVDGYELVFFEVTRGTILDKAFVPLREFFLPDWKWRFHMATKRGQSRGAKAPVLPGGTSKSNGVAQYVTCSKANHVCNLEATHPSLTVRVPRKVGNLLLRELGLILAHVRVLTTDTLAVRVWGVVAGVDELDVEEGIRFKDEDKRPYLGSSF